MVKKSMQMSIMKLKRLNKKKSVQINSLVNTQ